MSKRREYRRMMRALEDLDRVDAGKAPKRQLRREVATSTNLWVHGRTGKISGSYAAITDPVAAPRRRGTRWILVVALVVILVLAAISIPASRHALGLAGSSGPGAERILPPVKVTTHGPHTYIKTTGAEDQPATYNPCAVIDYTVNPDLEPAGTATIVPSAISEISALTGLQFRYAGISHAPAEYGTDGAETTGTFDHPRLAIVWSSAKDFISLDGDVIGWGGSAWNEAPGHDARFIGGTVALRVDALTEMLQQPNGPTAVRAVVLHELGHVVGLDHVKDQHQIMYPRMTHQYDFGPGDREGLALLGQGSCSR